ncbi:hypothetical protein SS50377_20121 [Spironucleus salmonicida]|uniref:Uncharacterized protein n=1 Tax=Spironucleus salmonicida TaxID=348837 RepID=V6LLU9_9EUKA|nr:hypothetical protein SS50377_20121 [Spironucleus salmonicida]|eukprot:EST45178.1 Hypothetical protein SS50377_14751 [Spironucleus salmonicida]
MSYAQASKQLKTGVQKDSSSKLQSVINKSKQLKIKINETQQEIKNEISIHSASNDSAQFKQALYISQQKNQNMDLRNQDNQDVAYNTSRPLPEQGFVLQTAKIQLDQLENDLLHQKVSQNKQKKLHKNDSVSEQNTTNTQKSMIQRNAQRVLSICPDTDSEPELYIPESVIIYIKTLNFISQQNPKDTNFQLRFYIQITGVPQQFKLFDLTSNINLVLINSTQPFIYQFVPDISIVIPYLENASIQIVFQGKINGFEVQGTQEISQFMKGNFSQKLKNQNYFLLHQTELIYDNFLQNTIFESSNFNLILNKQQVGDAGILQNQHFQTFKIIPFSTELIGFACPKRQDSMEFQRKNVNFQQVKQKVQFNSNLLAQNGTLQKQFENKGTQYELDELVENAKQKQRLQEIEDGLFYDQERNEYFIQKQVQSLVSVSQQPKILNLNSQNYKSNDQYVKTILNTTKISQLFIQRLEFDCLGEYSVSIISVQFVQNNIEKLVLQNQPIAAGHAMFTQSVPIFEQNSQQISPLVVHILIDDMVQQKKLIGVLSLEQLQSSAFDEKWIDLKPFGRMKCKVAALPSLIGRNVQYLDGNYQLISNQKESLYINNQKIKQQDHAQSVIPRHQGPMLNINTKIEIPNFQQEMSSILSQMVSGDSFNVSIGREEAQAIVGNFDQRQNNVISSAVKPQDDLLLAQQLIQAMKTKQSSSDLVLEQVGAQEVHSPIIKSPTIQTEDNAIQKSVAQQMKKIAYELSSDSESEQESPQRNSSWARQQAKKIFGGGISSSSENSSD